MTNPASHKIQPGESRAPHDPFNAPRKPAAARRGGAGSDTRSPARQMMTDPYWSWRYMHANGR